MASNNIKTKTAFIIRTVSGGYLVRYADGTEEAVDSQRVIRRTINFVSVEVVEK